MIGYLLDTHTALWWWTEARQLSRAAHLTISDSERPIFVSAVSALEIALKWRRGHLSMIGDPRENYFQLMQANGFAELMVSAAHGVLAGTLDGDHRDPFDRLIAAQALTSGLTVITRDPAIAAFGCEVLW